MTSESKGHFVPGRPIPILLICINTLHTYMLFFVTDEAGVWLDSVSGVTVERKGAKEVTVRNAKNEQLRITVLLTARANKGKTEASCHSLKNKTDSWYRF